jgi:hypothetical protein
MVDEEKIRFRLKELKELETPAFNIPVDEISSVTFIVA